METEIRECKYHGMVKHNHIKNGNGKMRWKCSLCSSEAVQKRREALKLKAIEYKGGECECCGYKAYSGALEFHHKDPLQKSFGIGEKGYTRSWEKVKEELDKCIMVCSNCHKEIHAGIREIPE